MNSLSWLVYGMQVFTNLGVLLAIVGGFVCVWLLFWGFCALCNDDQKAPLSITHFVKRFKQLIWVPVVCFTMLIFMPNERTMYLIAASEVGDRIVNSQKVQSIVDPGSEYLKTWLKKETERLNTTGTSK